jgi:hypothetical protein
LQATRLASLAAMAVTIGTVAIAPVSAHASAISMSGTGCSYYSDARGKQGSEIKDVQYALTCSYDGTVNNPISLVTQSGLLVEKVALETATIITIT